MGPTYGLRLVDMAAVILTYAQALRVIGQDLVPLRTNSFELAKWDDDYIVWMDNGDLVGDLSAKKTFFDKITQKILGHADSASEIPNRLYFSSSDIVFANIERGSK